MDSQTCSVLATDEPLIGTATRADCHFVMAHPKRAWLPRIEDMTGDAGDFARAVKASPQATVSLCDCPPQESGTIWLFPHGYRFAGLSTTDYPALVEGALNGRIPFAYKTVSGHYILVCTHGKRDACCAKYGRPTADALRQAAPMGVTVWDVSHLGGHRFAGTLVVQPANRWYGRLSPENAADLLAAIASNRVLTAYHRGNAHLPPPLQVAEQWALEQGAEAVKLLNPLISENSGTVDVLWGDGQRVHLHLSAQVHPFFPNCGSDETNTRLIWKAEPA